MEIPTVYLLHVCFYAFFLDSFCVFMLAFARGTGNESLPVPRANANIKNVHKCFHFLKFV